MGGAFNFIINHVLKAAMAAKTERGAAVLIPAEAPCLHCVGVGRSQLHSASWAWGWNGLLSLLCCFFPIALYWGSYFIIKHCIQV